MQDLLTNRTRQKLLNEDPQIVAKFPRKGGIFRISHPGEEV